MHATNLRKLTPVSLKGVTIADRFWAPRQEVNRTVTLPAEYEQCKKTGRIDAWKLDWKPGQPNPPHIFWDSDAAKWIEAVGYSLATHPDQELEELADAVIDMIADAQQEDGYLNIHFTVVEPQNRLRNLRDMHELYCAGHLIEAAVSYYEGTGKRKLLDVMCRYADYIDSVLGPEEGKKRGYPGHEEIELALVKLYRATGEQRYLKLAKFFVDERGRRPHFFDLEARERGEDPAAHRGGGYDYNQSHLPVREQTTAEGHAVRAMYLYSGMADVAAETDDETLLAACERLWQNVTERRLYITGGIGSSARGERFTYDYELPNDAAYAETCAAIGLVFWAHRMLQFDGNGVYADVMERALYNGVLSGISLDGRRFLYVNPLEVDMQAHRHKAERFGRPRFSPTRQEWFSCACCPPNIARLLASLGAYIYSQAEKEVYVHLYVEGSVELSIDGHAVALQVETDYPWGETVTIAVHPDQATGFSLALRIPAWCRAAEVKVNGEQVGIEPLMDNGYAKIRRIWQRGDVVTLRLPMDVVRVEAHPAVRANCGRIALHRGPLIYCLEEADNGGNLRDISLPDDAELRVTFDENLLGGIAVIHAEGKRRDLSRWKDRLYQPLPSATRTIALKAIPYYAWSNRTPGDMLVWIGRG